MRAEQFWLDLVNHARYFGVDLGGSREKIDETE
jgi:hypothetical protein